MLKHIRFSLVLMALVGLAVGPMPVMASNAEAPTSEPPVHLLSPEQLDKLLAPIALYPDPLLAQILPASTQPGEIVMANRYVTSGKDPNKIDAQPWDESVKALARYPDVLAKMDKQLDWTTQLGEAFIAQPSDVFASVQRLRAQAQAVGNLKSTPQQVVTTEQTVIQIMPADPQVIYVPQYQPDVVYVQQPVNVVAPLITFGAGLALGVWIHNSVDWHSNNVYYYNNGWNSHYPNGGWNNNYYHGGNNNINIDNSKNVNIGNGSGNNGSVWKPQNKPGNGNGNGNWPNNGANRPGNGNGNGNAGNLPNNGANRPGTGNGNAGYPPNNGGNRPGNGGGQKPTTLPAKPTDRPNAGNMQKPATRPQPSQDRPMTMPTSGPQHFNREGTKPNQNGGNRAAQANRPTQGNRQAPSGGNRQAGGNRAAGSGGGGGGGRAQR